MTRNCLILVCAAATVAASSAQVLALQGEVQQPLAEHPQSVMFLKSNATDPKVAIANLLITQVGLPLLTMGLSTQMRMWNPYMGDTFAKAANLGLGVLSGHGTDTNGFEYEMLPGLTAPVGLKPGPAEFVLPVSRYLPPGDAAGEDVQPLLVRLERRDKDQARLISARHVLLKENKKSRFDLKPSIERNESAVEQQLVPVEVRRDDGNVYHIVTKGPLQTGEYALLLRKKSQAGEYSSNVALKPVSHEPGQPAVAPPNVAQKSRLSGMMHRPASPVGLNPMQPEQPQQQLTAFIAWDFHVQ